MAAAVVVPRRAVVPANAAGLPRAQDRVPASNDVASYDGYTLVDLAMRWQPKQNGWQNWRVNLALDNLADQFYMPAFNQLYAPGRNGKLSVAYQF